MTRWGVWSDADGWLTDPLPSESEATEALEQLVAVQAAEDDDIDIAATPSEHVMSVLPVCPHGSVSDRCGRCSQ